MGLHRVVAFRHGGGKNSADGGVAVHADRIPRAAPALTFMRYG
jgi:hypothetical protein